MSEGGAKKDEAPKDHTVLEDKWQAFLVKIQRPPEKVLAWKEDNLAVELKKQGFDGLDAEDIIDYWRSKQGSGSAGGEGTSGSAAKDAKKGNEKNEEIETKISTILANKPPISSYHTTTTPSLLESQQQLAGPLLHHPLPPATYDSNTLNPLYILAVGDHHKKLVKMLLEGSTIMIFNVSGAGKTKFAYSIVLEHIWDVAMAPPIVILITVGVPREDKRNLSETFSLIQTHCKERMEALRNLQPSIGMLRDLHENSLHYFRCLELAYLVLLQHFCSLYQGDDFRERWLRYQLNGGDSCARRLFMAYSRQSVRYVKTEYAEVSGLLRIKYNVVFFYDEAGALADKVQGCCLHQEFLDSSPPPNAIDLWRKEIEGTAATTHAHATDLLYALRQSVVGIRDTCHAFADADEVIIRQLVSGERSGTLPLRRFSSFIFVTVPMMLEILSQYFSIPERGSPIIAVLVVQLKLELAYFVGRARHFFDYYLPTVWQAMCHKPPLDVRALLELLISCAKVAQGDLLARFKATMTQYQADKRTLTIDISRKDLVSKCLMATCLQNGKLCCNCEAVRDLITGNIVVLPELPADLSANKNMNIDLCSEPVIKEAILAVWPPNCLPQDDPVFLDLLKHLGTLSAANSAKGDLGDWAVAWAFCRLARMNSSLGNSLQAVLPNAIIPEALFKYRFCTQMIAGTSTDFGHANDLAACLATKNYVFPPFEAGPDGLVSLIPIQEDSQAGDEEVLPDSQAGDEEVLPDSQAGDEDSECANEKGLMSVQSKVRASFDILDAIYSTNPYLVYSTKEDRRNLALTGPSSFFAASQWTTTQHRVGMRNTLTEFISGAGCIVRVLFSAGGFPAEIVTDVDEWNVAHPNAPIVLLYPTAELFGPALAETLKTLANLSTKIDGKTTFNKRLAIRKLDGSCVM